MERGRERKIKRNKQINGQGNSENCAEIERQTDVEIGKKWVIETKKSNFKEKN